MRNNKYKLVAISSVAIILIIVFGLFVFNKNNSHESENDDLRSDKTAIVRVLASKKSPYALYSIDAENGSSQNNLSELLELTPHSRVVSNENVSKIAYVIETESDLSIWKADSDGSNAIKIFQTNNTGCNEVKVLGISREGQDLIFSNQPYVDYEMGGPCVPQEEPSLNDEGVFYFKDSILPSKISNFDSEHFLGFHGTDIMFFTDESNDKYRVGSVWKMNAETLEAIKIFDTPRELLWGNFMTIKIFPDANRAIYEIASTDIGNPANTGEIILFDYKNNIIDTIASGEFAEFQGSNPSPNFKKIAYVHEIRKPGWESTGMPETEYYVYDIKSKKSDLVVFPEKEATGRVSIMWKSDSSFFYIAHPNNYSEEGNLRLFNLNNFTSGESMGTFFRLGYIVNRILTI
jgi:hypothetical protein